MVTLLRRWAAGAAMLLSCSTPPEGVCGASGECTRTLVQRSCAAAGTPGCGMVAIVGGSFTLGTATNCAGPPDATCGAQASPQQTNVTVGNFALDAYEVTVARFNAYWSVRARDMASVRSAPIRYRGGTIAWQAPPNAEPSRETSDCNWLPTSSSRDGHPMNCVDYWMAQEFCVWDGGHLPTEAEWEYAARGGARAGLAAGRIYPWGDTPPSPSCDRARWNTAACSGEDGGGTRRVGSFSAGAAGGVFDLAGNVWEWVADQYTAYGTSGGPGSCGNRSGTTNALCNDDAVTSGVRALRAVRGGAWGSPNVAFLRSASRISLPPAVGIDLLGFRCARDTP